MLLGDSVEVDLFEQRCESDPNFSPQLTALPVLEPDLEREFPLLGEDLGGDLPGDEAPVGRPDPSGLVESTAHLHRILINDAPLIEPLYFGCLAGIDSPRFHVAGYWSKILFHAYGVFW